MAGCFASTGSGARRTWTPVRRSRSATWRRIASRAAAGRRMGAPIRSRLPTISSAYSARSFTAPRPTRRAARRARRAIPTIFWCTARAACKTAWCMSASSWAAARSLQTRIGASPSTKPPRIWRRCCTARYDACLNPFEPKGGDMKFLAQAAVGLGVLMLAAMPVRADDIKPAVVFDLGGKFDKSFNQGVAGGADKFTKETGIKYTDFVATNDTQFEQAHRRFAERGQDPIIGVGFAQADAVGKVAKDFPKTRWTIIDGIANLPNVQSVLFKEHEGSFLVGIAAAMKTKTGKVGFVGGMDIPLIRRFQCG